jgi:SAM-dependent methyltransferase
MSGGGSILSKFQKYLDPNRKVGSQSETPGITLTDGVVTLSGYQSFKVTHGQVDKTAISRKYKSLHKYFIANRNAFGPTASLLDIGCSAGLLCFLAKECGFSAVTGLDHDPEYIEVMKAASKASGLKVNALVGDWKSAQGTYDVVCVLALVHWIYSLTGTEGSFASIYRYLYAHTNRYLLIEWVDPKDPAIGHLHHISANPEHHREPYERSGFEAAGLRYFGAIDAKIDTTPTRCIYVFRKERRIYGHSSVVSLGQTAVAKTFHDEIIKYHPTLIGRERRALRLLDGVPGIPYVLASTDQEIQMTFCGEPIAQNNVPADAETQARQIVADMRKRGVQHNDIHKDNVLVLDGKLHLIDFAWASATGDSLDFLPHDIGVNYGVRRHGEPVDDLAMFLRTIELIRIGTPKG